jgi:hypothetical protein
MKLRDAGLPANSDSLSGAFFVLSFLTALALAGREEGSTQNKKEHVLALEKILMENRVFMTAAANAAKKCEKNVMYGKIIEGIAKGSNQYRRGKMYNIGYTEYAPVLSIIQKSPKMKEALAILKSANLKEVQALRQKFSGMTVN